MSIPVQPGRLDLLLMALAQQACSQYIDPKLPTSGVWDAGLNRVAAHAIARARIPQTPITHVQLGQLRLPIEAVSFLARLCGMDRRLPGADA